MDSALRSAKPRAAVSLALVAAICAFAAIENGSASVDVAEKPKAGDWSAYNGQITNDHYSPLDLINRANAHLLREAWRYNTGETGGLQDNPLVVAGRMYVYSPTEKIIALDAATGKVLWTFDSGTEGHQPNRGMCLWTDGKESRLLASVMDHLYALDPATGKVIPSFGDNGAVDLRKDLGEADYTSSFAVMTTPGVLYKDLIITGFRAPEAEPAPHGDIRAYDVHTGKLRWSFHTIPHPGEPGYQTWPKDAWKVTGAANNWAGMALDEKRGIVFAPTGSAVTDFYGYDRLGDDLYANTLLALDANTGKRIWHFQGVHHDIWDRDFPSAPALITVRHNGQLIDAVAQTTKQGSLFLFERATGKPLFPITERPFPPSDVPGEVTSPTQPLPSIPEPYARQRLTADMLTQRTPEAHAWAVENFKDMRSDGQFVPLSLGKQTIVFPGFDGGAEWGGPAVDPHSGVIYINSNDIAWTGGLTPNERAKSPGEATYMSQCSACHGPSRQGSPPAFPSLVDIHQRLTDAQISDVIHQGRGRMPSFPGIDQAHLATLLTFLDSSPLPEGANKAKAEEASSKHEAESSGSPADPAPYRFTGYRRFVDPDGYPAILPPWGTLNAIDLNTGKYLWKISLGEYPELTAKGVKPTGSENYGGPVATAGGLIIIAATVYDHTIRIFDSSNGNLLWKADLPFAGVATPSTYMVDGKQYIVIATSNQRTPSSPQGAVYVAFALP